MYQVYTPRFVVGAALVLGRSHLWVAVAASLAVSQKYLYWEPFLLVPLAARTMSACEQQEIQPWTIQRQRIKIKQESGSARER